MSNNRLKFDGMQEFKKSLRDLPVEMHAEAENEIDAEANQAALEIRMAYKRKSGALMEGVFVERVERTRFFAGRRVVSKSPLAIIYEIGSQVRHTALGWNRGRMPPAHIFIPAMIRHRKEMYDRLREMMRRKGLKVIG